MDYCLLLLVEVQPPKEVEDALLLVDRFRLQSQLRVVRTVSVARSVARSVTRSVTRSVSI